MTHPHEGLQERALREGMRECPFCQSTDIYIEPDEVGSGGQWVSPVYVGCNVQTGCGFARAFGDDKAEAEVKRLREALSTLPQQAATNEGEVERAAKAYAEATGYYVEFHRGLSSPSADKIRTGIRAALSAISTPTSAETRLREVVKDALTFTCMSIAFIGRDQGSPRVDDMLNGLCKLAVELEPKLRAALTQPEPTAQQAPESLAEKQAREVMNPGFGSVSAPSGGQSYNASAQQAAGEAEAVDAARIAAAFQPELWSDDEDTAHRAASPFNVAYAREKSLAGAKAVLSRLGPLYATPQPTETQRIVAWLRGEALDDHPDNHELWTDIADAIERGEHLAGERE